VITQQSVVHDHHKNESKFDVCSFALTRLMNKVYETNVKMTKRKKQNVKKRREEENKRSSQQKHKAKRIKRKNRKRPIKVSQNKTFDDAHYS